MPQQKKSIVNFCMNARGHLDKSYQPAVERTPKSNIIGLTYKECKDTNCAGV